MTSSTTGTATACHFVYGIPKSADASLAIFTPKEQDKYLRELAAPVPKSWAAVTLANASAGDPQAIFSASQTEVRERLNRQDGCGFINTISRDNHRLCWAGMIGLRRGAISI
jgi:hypothetical protein